MDEEEFNKKWKDAKQYGDDLKGYTKQLVDLMENGKIPENLIELIINLFSEVEGLIQWLSDAKLEEDAFLIWHKEQYLKHRHIDGEIFVPEQKPRTKDC